MRGRETSCSDAGLSRPFPFGSSATGTGGWAALKAAIDDSSCGRDVELMSGRHRKCVRGGCLSGRWFRGCLGPLRLAPAMVGREWVE